jgi:aldose 1-epimerase
VSVPVGRRLVLDRRGLPTGATEELARGALSGSLGDRTFDDCSDRLERQPDGSPPELALADGRLRIGVEFVSGFCVAQVYAPPRSEFICFEPMTAPVDALCSGRDLRFAAPGETFLAEFAVTVTEN